MKRKKTTSAALALVAAAILGTSAHAANATYAAGDLLIGFEQAGNASDYLVDLGAVTQFTNPLSATLTFNLSTTDLSGVFGSSWADNGAASLVQWGVIGASNKTGGTLTLNGTTFANNTIFLTVGEATPWTQSTPPTEGSSSTQSNWNTNIVALDKGSGGFNGTTITGNGSLQAIIQSSSASNSYAFEINKPNFGTGISIQQPTSGTATGPTDSVLDLYQLNPNFGETATYLGDFSLNSAGVLTFTSAAVPEPSSVVLLGLGAMLLLWGANRKGSSQV